MEVFSIFGVDVELLVEGCIIYIDRFEKMTYSPTLSSMMIVIDDSALCEIAFKELQTKGYISESEVYQDLTFQNRTIQATINSLLSIEFANGITRVEFYEQKPFHSRQLLITELEATLELEFLRRVSMCNVNPTSWISIHWHCCRSLSNLNTAFTIYYQLSLASSSSILSGKKSSTKKQRQSILPIVGLLHTKLELTAWLCTVGQKEVKKNLSIIRNLIVAL